MHYSAVQEYLGISTWHGRTMKKLRQFGGGDYTFLLKYYHQLRILVNINKYGDRYLKKKKTRRKMKLFCQTKN